MNGGKFYLFAQTRGVGGTPSSGIIMMSSQKSWAWINEEHEWAFLLPQYSTRQHHITTFTSLSVREDL